VSRIDGGEEFIEEVDEESAIMRMMNEDARLKLILFLIS